MKEHKELGKNIVGRTFRTTAVRHYKDDETMIYASFEVSKKYAYMWGEKSEGVIDVELTVIEQDVWLEEYYKTHDCNTPDYFAYYNLNDDNLSMIFCNVKCYNCCFPYGADHHCYDYEGNRQGSTVIVSVKEMSNVESE